MTRAVACPPGCTWMALLGLLLLAACGGGGADDSPLDSPGDVVVADFEGDGRDDLAVGDLSAGDRADVAMPCESGVLIWMQDPDRPGVLLRGPAPP